MSSWTATYDSAAEEDIAAAGKWWWFFLVTGCAWLIIALIVLRFNLKSVGAIAIMAGLVVLAAGVNELMAAFVSPGWKWLHALVGVLFFITGILCFVYPGRTFVTLAMFFGWFLLFKGILDVMLALLSRHANDLWWLGLVTGIIEIGLAFWAAGYFAGSATLLIVWVGISALMRGVSEIAMAFMLRKLGSVSGDIVAA
jgi:uncharacterized membrane protein HdeD (DUF308 family)